MQVSNQENLYRQMQTYPEADSASYIAPYVSPAWTVTADAEGTLPHYDVYNETHWVDQSMNDGYKIPITADDGNTFAQRRTYPEADSNSYIAPYVSTAWTVTADAEGTLPHYDVYNETHWVDQSMNDGYKIPITADDGNTLVQKQHRTYPEADSNSYIAPYVVKDHAWTVSADAEGTLPHYDVYNETHWVDQSMNDGYKIPITADDGDSLVQKKSVSHAALAQVATKTRDADWLCDVRGEDGKPFYVSSYDEYHHCASMFRVTADDNLHHASLA